MTRYLVVGSETIGSSELGAKLRELAAEGDATFHFVVPATHPQGVVYTEGHAVAVAQQRLDAVVEGLHDLGLTATGEVGDERPVDAVRDAIANDISFEAIVLSTFPPGRSRWLGLDLPHRLQRTFDLPVIHVVSNVGDDLS